MLKATRTFFLGASLVLVSGVGAHAASIGWESPAPRPLQSSVPLDHALALLVPSGQTTVLFHGVDPQAPVHWSAGATRAQALHEVLQEQHLSAQGDSMHLTISALKAGSQDAFVRMPTPAAHPAPAAAKPAPTVAKAPAPVVAKVAAPAASAAKPAATPAFAATRDWTIHKGQSISEALRQWADVAGWTVIWQPQQDWEAPHDTHFSGTFSEAVSQVVDALVANGVTDLRAHIGNNETIVVYRAGTNPAVDSK